jgi:hypothetical protein
MSTDVKKEFVISPESPIITQTQLGDGLIALAQEDRSI